MPHAHDLDLRHRGGAWVDQTFHMKHRPPNLMSKCANPIQRIWYVIYACVFERYLSSCQCDMAGFTLGSGRNFNGSSSSQAWEI